MHLLRRGDVWFFRQRVPNRLIQRFGRREFWRSLSTESKRIARYRASQMYIAMQELFELAEDERLTQEDLNAIARIWLKHVGLADQIDNLLPGQLRKFKLPNLLAASLLPGKKWKPSVLAPYDSRIRSILHAAGYECTEARTAQVREEFQSSAQNYLDYRKRLVFQVPLEERVETPSSLDTDGTASALSTYFESYAEEMTQGEIWSDHTRAQNLNSLRLIVRVCGDKLAGSYTRDDAKLLRRALERVPANFGKSPSHFKGDINNVLRDEPGPDTLSIGTLERHWTTITAFFNWLDLQPGVPRLDVKRLLQGFIWNPNVPQAKSRLVWDEMSLQALLRSPIWTGFSVENDKPYWRYTPGKVIVRDHHYWLPLLAIYSGARLEELSQLRREDIELVDGVCVIRITDEHPQQKLKTKASKRKFPIHSELIKLGFLPYVQNIGKGWVFPEMTPSGRRNARSHVYTEHFTQYRKRVGLYKKLVDFHSFRHTYITALLNSKADRAAISQLVGHSTAELQKIALEAGIPFGHQSLPSTQTMEYFGGFTMGALIEASEHLRFPKLDLSHLYE